MEKKKHYDQAFKERAVKLSYERGSVLSVARELGVSSSSIYGWQRKYCDVVEVDSDQQDAPYSSDEQSEDKDSAMAALALLWYMYFL